MTAFLLAAALALAPADTTDTGVFVTEDGSLATAVDGVIVEGPVDTELIREIPPGQEVDWAMETAGKLRSAASEDRWGPFVSVLLMALLSLFSFVFVRSQDLRKAIRPYMPEVAVGTSMLAYIAVAVGTLPPGAEVADWWGVIGPALKTGAAAVGFYDILVKRLLRFWGPKIVRLVKRLLGKTK
jgi:hypothetical protein